ncbi:MAG: DNA methyltransferase [Candidatus Jordarchaeaceae archaeon]
MSEKRKREKPTQAEIGDYVEGVPKKIGERVGEHGIYLGARGIYDVRNRLNDLTGTEWAKFTRSWFIHNPEPRKGDEILHPAKFPESLIEEFILFFTKEGELVLDPMAGTGSTLVACDNTGRRGIGIELVKKWADIARKRTKQTIIQADALELDKLNLPTVDFCITSPPYWNMLRKSRGHVKSVAHIRKELGLDIYYSDIPEDIGNIAEYSEYLNALYKVFEQVYHVLRNNRYLVVIIQNIRTEEGEMIPVAWDLAKKLSTLYVLKQERIWCQNNKMLGIWGYPFTYVSNVHHHYCLIFEKDEEFRKKKHFDSEE